MRSAYCDLFGVLRLLGCEIFRAQKAATLFLGFNRPQALGYFFPRAFPNWWSDLCASNTPLTIIIGPSSFLP